MQFSLLSLSVMLAPVALANFQVYCGEWANGIDGAGFAPACKFFDHTQLSCSDVLGAVTFYVQNDVSDSKCGGVRCKGCEGDNISDWVVTELEVNDYQGCTPSTRYWDTEGSEDPPHFTIYRNGDSVSIIGSNGQGYGTCSVPSDPQGAQCSDGLGNGFIVHRFDCQSPLSYRV